MEFNTDGIVHRILSALAISTIPIAGLFKSGASEHGAWWLLALTGWLVFATAWFLRPAVLILNSRERAKRTAELAILSPSRFLGLCAAGLLIVAVSFLAGHTSAA